MASCSVEQPLPACRRFRPPEPDATLLLGRVGNAQDDAFIEVIVVR